MSEQEGWTRTSDHPLLHIGMGILVGTWLMSLVVIGQEVEDRNPVACYIVTHPDSASTDRPAEGENDG